MDTEREIVGMVSMGRTLAHGHRKLKNVSGEWFYLIEKNKPFFNFGRTFFEEPPKNHVWGESINTEALTEALNNDCTILFIYPAAIYSIKASDLYKYAKDHNTIRQQIGRKEETYSVPLDIMKWRKRELS